MMNAQPTTMTPEQKEAHREHAGWLKDCGKWRSDHRQALSMLAKVQAAILEQESALESHAALIQAHEMHLQKYTLAAYAPGTADDAMLEADHAEFEEKHQHAREAHERMSKHHRSIVDEVAKLLGVCESGM